LLLRCGQSYRYVPMTSLASFSTMTQAFSSTASSASFMSAPAASMCAANPPKLQLIVMRGRSRPLHAILSRNIEAAAIVKAVANVFDSGGFCCAKRAKLRAKCSYTEFNRVLWFAREQERTLLEHVHWRSFSDELRK
jgi:hypothetical protein